MIKIVFNFKCIYTYACVTNYFFFNNLINYLFLKAFIFWQKKKKSVEDGTTPTCLKKSRNR